MALVITYQSKITINSLETLIVAYILKYMYMLFSIDSKNGNTDRTMFGRQQVQQ